MITRLLDGASPSAVAAAVDLLARGHPVALPTETVYGLAADALSPTAAAGIFAAKERPRFNPLIVHLPSLEWLDRLTTAASDPLVQALASRFWPGPLTLVLPRRDLVPDLVAAGLPTVALRMSAHPVLQTVLSRFGRPLAAPSANRFGRISPTIAAHVWSELDGRIPLILDGGPCALGLESTIVAVGEGTLRLLRSGPVTAEALADLAPVAPPENSPAIQAPGQLPSHYAPRTPLRLLPDEASAAAPPATGRTGLLSFARATPPPAFAAMETLSAKRDLAQAATRLFAALRRLDALALDLILAEPVPELGLGLAIMDRLRRASHIPHSA